MVGIAVLAYFIFIGNPFSTDGSVFSDDGTMAVMATCDVTDTNLYVAPSGIYKVDGVEMEMMEGTSRKVPPGAEVALLTNYGGQKIAETQLDCKGTENVNFVDAWNSYLATNYEASNTDTGGYEGVEYDTSLYNDDSVFDIDFDLDI